ncbi:MAG: hypothetical protein GY873_39285, partial [Bosea sp.]|uniref:hypothetical protein n=1 Tax=Bosea sp. (in: a-proteobacteria) TaxID=1871050 RepID=UPI0023A68CD3|nr:hypothetical protein [Bosea sp. (in: a-proteobacteria)]
TRRLLGILDLGLRLHQVSGRGISGRPKFPELSRLCGAASLAAAVPPIAVPPLACTETPCMGVAIFGHLPTARRFGGDVAYALIE